jgi:hypothetical protein
MKGKRKHRGALAAFSALASFAVAGLVAPSNAAAQLSKGLGADILLQRAGASLLVLSEPIPAGAGSENGDNFTGNSDYFNLPTTAPNFSKIHDFTSFRLTAPFSCRNCLADVQNAIKNGGTIYVALAPAGYCATQFPTEGWPAILRIPAAELQVSKGLTGTLFSWSGRPEALPLLDAPAGSSSAPAAAARLATTAVGRQPRFVNLHLTISSGPVQGILGSLGVPAETGELDADGDLDLAKLLASTPASGPASVNTDVVLALATGMAASDDVTAPSDPNLPLGFVASCETLNAPITFETPPGI